MNLDYYISIYNSISKAVVSLLLVTVLIEGYLVQRCFEVNANLQEKVIDLDDPAGDDPVKLGHIIGTELRQTRTEALGLKVNYATLSILWPVILLAFFTAIYYALNKRLKVIRELKGNHVQFKLSLLTLDLFSFSFTGNTATKMFVLAFFYALPFTGLVFHAYSGFFMANLIEPDSNAYNESPASSAGVIRALSALFYAQAIISIIFLLGILVLNSRSAKLFTQTAGMLKSS